MILILYRLEYDIPVIPDVLIKYIDNANYCCNCGSACFDRHIREITNRFPIKVAQILFQISQLINFEFYYCSLYCCNYYHSFMHSFMQGHR